MRGWFVCATLVLLQFSGLPQAAWAEANPDCQAFLTAPRFSQSVKPIFGNHIQFGFESEYTRDELEHIVTYYRAKSVSAKNWLLMNADQRVAYVQERIMRVVAYAEPSGLIRISSVPGPDFLPSELVIDSTGNIEFVLPPIDTYAEYRRRMSYINRTFGVGSMQSTVSTPMGAFFDYASPADLIGFLKFYSDFDTIEKLVKGSARFKAKPNADTVRSFQHPFLGPMTKMKMDRLVEYVNGNVEGRLLDRESLQFIKAMDSSFKYFGGTAYRPDLAAPARIVLEVRDAHKDEAMLVSRVQRISQFFEEVRLDYSRYAQLQPFDSQADFAKLPKHLQDMLQELFPSRVYTGVEYTDEELIANQVGRNFAWPLRNWSGHTVLGPEFQLRHVILAQGNYVKTLQEIYVALGEKRIDSATAKFQVQGALGQFVDEIRIFEVFQNIDRAILKETNSKNQKAS